VGEIMNIMIKQTTSKGEIKGVVMPIRQRMQIFSQYTNDPSFTLIDEENNVDRVIGIFNYC
jgi:hypothetical protein